MVELSSGILDKITAEIPPSEPVVISQRTTTNVGCSYDLDNRRITTPMCQIDNVMPGVIEEAGFDSVAAWYNIKSEENSLWRRSDDPSFLRVSNNSYIRKDDEDDNAFTWNCNIPLSDNDFNYNIGFKARFVKGTSGWVINYDEICELSPVPASSIRSIIRGRMAPAFIRRKSLGPAVDDAEHAARETLRRVIGDVQFRRFLKYGHVSVKAKSGSVYQLFTGHTTTKVYRNGRCFERLCVVLPADFPPTDSLIMRYLLVLNDEREFRKMANVSANNDSFVTTTIGDCRPLAEIYRDIKSGTYKWEAA